LYGVIVDPATERLYWINDRYPNTRDRARSKRSGGPTSPVWPKGKSIRLGRRRWFDNRHPERQDQEERKGDSVTATIEVTAAKKPKEK
jgi:hypothetical protein